MPVCYPAFSNMRRIVSRLPRLLAAGSIGLAALLAALAPASAASGATATLSTRVDEVVRDVEKVRGRRFQRPVSATEIDIPELKKVLRTKLFEGFPASVDDTLRTLVAMGFFEETPRLIDRLVDFYASQVIAFYDPDPKRLFFVKGSPSALPDMPLGEGASGAAEKMIFAHELTHALQDENLHLDRRMKELKENGDRALALQSLLEGEATLVMVKVMLAELPVAQSAEVEDSLAPLLSAGALEKANIPKDLPDYFVDQLFFPYAEGTAYARRVQKASGWEGLDRLWKNPPATSSEILHEGPAFTPAENLIDAAAARKGPEGFHPLYTDTVGEWGVRFLLRKALTGDDEKSDVLAAGWRGDRVAFFGSGKNVAYLWRLRFDSPTSAEKFETAWKTSRKRGETVKRVGTDVTITSGFPPEDPPRKS
jgi:hypothetical protein